MSTGDRIAILVAAGAISATLGVGTCSTNARIGDVYSQLNVRIDDTNARIDDTNARIDDTNARIDDTNTRIDEMNLRFEARFDDVQDDIRELRALIVDALKRRESVD